MSEAVPGKFSSPDQMSAASAEPMSAPIATSKVPAVSVVMSVYNAGRYLAASVESILSQSFRDFEFIIIDDGSKDGSRAILAEFEKRDVRLRVVSRPNKGLTASLNEGVSLATAPLIARMDADDVALPDRFATQVGFMNAHPDVVVVGSRVELIDPYDVPIGVVEYPADHATIDARLLVGEGGVIPHPASMFRTETFRRVGGYREQFNNSEDLDLWLRLAEVGQVANIPQVLLRYRRDLASVSHTKRDNQMRLKSRILGEAYDRRGLTKPQEWHFDAWMPKPPADQFREWGWRALKLSRPDAARGHAKSLLRLRPFSPQSWRLAFCAWRGR